MIRRCDLIQQILSFVKTFNTPITSIQRESYHLRGMIRLAQTTVMHETNFEDAFGIRADLPPWTVDLALTS